MSDSELLSAGLGVVAVLLPAIYAVNILEMSESAVQVASQGAGRRDIRLLFTCAGRRIELIEAFRRSAKELGLRASIHVADAEKEFAAACIADRVHQVPTIGGAEYIPALLEIARKHRIDLLIPLLDVELLPISTARDLLAEAGCHAVISSPGVVQVCRDKILTYHFLVRHGIDTPRTWPAEEVVRRVRHKFPYFIKPKAGSASKGSFIIRDLGDLQSLTPRIHDAMIQEFVPGIEYTLDVYTGYDGRPRCVVPRQRLEVRGGEVTKARTVKRKDIMQVGVRVCEALANCRGCITIQLIATPENRLRVIEINPRFGGGVPLAIRAGADFPGWLMAQWLGRKPAIRLDKFEDDLLMLRYHQSFFTHNGNGNSGAAKRKQSSAGRRVK